jgi:hypothetical protein
LAGAGHVEPTEGHADPHPANLVVMPDNKICFIDITSVPAGGALAQSGVEEARRPSEVFRRQGFIGRRLRHQVMQALLVLYMVKYLFLPERAETVIGYDTLKATFEAVFGPLGVQRLLNDIIFPELVQATASTGRTTLASIDKSILKAQWP